MFKDWLMLAAGTISKGLKASGLKAGLVAVGGDAN